MLIKNIQAYLVYDSKGYPTLGGELILTDGRKVTAKVANNLSKVKYGAGESLCRG